MHMHTIRMQAVLSNYISRKQLLEEILNRKVDHPLHGIIEELFQAIIGFFGAGEWELCSEACSYLKRLEEYLKNKGENLEDYMDQFLGPYPELVRLLCRILPVMRRNSAPEKEDLER